MLSILWSFVLALHLLCMAYWVGGGVVTVVASRTSTSLLDGAQRQTALLQIYFRYCRALLHVVPVSLLTGWALIVHLGGFAVMPWPVNIMQLLGIVMAILAALTFFGPVRSVRRAIRPAPGALDSIRGRIVLMTALGALTTLCGALTGA